MSILTPYDEVRRLTAGDCLDRYELLCPIAEGGMASVWLANQRGKYGFQKRVALKTILPSYALEPCFRAMFIDESRLASRVHHENVAQVLDLGEDGDILYLVIECVDGDSLRTLERAAGRRGVPVPQELLLRALADTCAGLHAAHELSDEQGKLLGVVHRDISPQNILISADGGTKVIDFGIAKARHRLASETTPGTVKGKQPYMAPEQALGLPVDRRADIWSVGAVFYRLVTGRVVYEACSPLATMEFLRRGRPEEPLDRVASVHPAICAVMNRALSPQASDRFATAADMRDALEGAIVESHMNSSPKGLAALFDTHLGKRRAARQEAIRLALDAATKRARERPTPAPPPPTPATPASRAVTSRPGASCVAERLDALEAQTLVAPATEEDPKELESLFHVHLAKDRKVARYEAIKLMLKAALKPPASTPPPVLAPPPLPPPPPLPSPFVLSRSAQPALAWIHPPVKPAPTPQPTRAWPPPPATPAPTVLPAPPRAVAKRPGAYRLTEPTDDVSRLWNPDAP